VAEGDRVVIRWTARGAQHGELHGIAPTGKRMTTPGVYETAVVVPASGLHRLSLRITRSDTALELPIVPAPAS